VRQSKTVFESRAISSALLLGADMLRKNLMLSAAVVLLAMTTLSFFAELEPAATKARPSAVMTPSPPIWAGFQGGPTLGWAAGAANAAH
jgi:hypothetical protein